MDRLQKGWFTEFSPDDLERMKNEGASVDDKLMRADGVVQGGAWPGQAFSLQVRQVLHNERSKFQDVLLFESVSHGKVLVLDGIIQCTERDEFSYQEMLAHLPMFAHPDPKQVLIIGGGDGGILREVLKHDCVQRVVMCEIDEMVISVAKKYLPHMSSGFDHPKLQLHVGDGFEFLRQHKGEFDVIVTDSSDPIGPAESLFGESYYELCAAALREGGVLASQAESAWLHLPLIQHMMSFSRRIFRSVGYASSPVMTYPAGLMGYLVASNTDRKLDEPSRTLTDEDVERMQLRFYNSHVHRAAFVLPQFVAKALRDSGATEQQQQQQQQ